MNIEEIKSELIEFSKYAAKVGGSSWYDIPLWAIDNYLKSENFMKRYRDEKIESILNEK